MTTMDMNMKGGPRQPAAVTGVQLAQGVGVQEAKGFWADAWSQVIRRPGAICGLAWVGIVLFFAVFSPILASGHPLILRELDAAGNVVRTTNPLLRYLSAADVLLILGGIAAPLWLLLPLPMKRRQRGGILLAAFAQSAIIVLAAAIISSRFSGRDVTDWMRELRDKPDFVPLVCTLITVVVSLPFLLLPTTSRILGRIAIVGIVGIVTWWAIGGLAFPQVESPFLSGRDRWQTPIERFDYRQREAMGEVKAVYTLVPFSPTQGTTSWFTLRPGTTLSEIHGEAAVPRTADARFRLGTDVVGQDVLSQMMHASRLSISIGLVSTSIAVVIGVTIGALMGYFGGWVDLLLYRVVEIFMAIPVLFLLIVAAAVLPRSTYVMMAIIGCVSWTGAARFVRAEFYKLRNQDFVQSARAVGLPLPSILFKHMLPNGVTPVLVDSSFAIAAAILAEAILSYLGLGPVGQPSWGRLLSGATSEVGAFVWWLAIFPGFAIFFTVLSYNLIGEALRDAIDPKLKKARV